MTGNRIACARRVGVGGLLQRCSRNQQIGQLPLDEARMDLLRCKLGSQRQRLQQWQVGSDAVDAALAQRAQRATQHIGKAHRWRMHDQLGQQRVVVRRW